MIDGLRPYAEMKPSGLPWLGDVPAHWDVRRNGRLFGSRRETGFPDLPVLEVSLRSGVRVRDFDNGTRKQEMGDRSKYQRAVRGDIAYNMMRMWQGAVGIAPVDGLVSPAYVVARPFAETDAAYYAYVFRTAAYMREVDTFSRGIVPDRNRLYWESFKQMPSVYPPLGEQRLIVRFLDWHGAQTAKLIRAKKKIIALLNEQKQAIIHRAVTRGLDPNVRLKPSGIPWLGDVPEGWEVKRLKYVLREREERKGATEHELLSLTRKRGLIPQSEASERPPSAEDLSKYKVCVPNDIVMNRMQAWSGLFALADRIGVVSPDYAVFSVVDATLPEFLVRVLRSPRLVDQFAVLSQGIGDGFNRLYTPTLGTVEIALPPKKEQSSIVKAIEEHDAQVDHAVQVLDNEIALIQEFRTRLIADVVTGKLDVRAAAAGLPETSEAEPIENLTKDEDLDEAADDAENEEVAA